MSESLEQVSVETDDGRVLTGVGVTEESLHETVERHSEPVEPTTEPAEPAAPPVPRNPDGTFTKPPRGRQRIDALTGEREAEKRRADAAERERDTLRQELETARRAQPASPVVSAPVAPVAEPPKPTRTKPSEDEVGTKYQSYGEFVEDLADWKAEQRLAALDLDASIRKSIEADRASRSQQDAISQLRARAVQVYPDFNAVLAAATFLIGKDPTADQQRTDYLISRPDGEHLIYAIAKDRALASKLAGMSDVEFGIELSKMALPPAVASPASTAAVVSVTPPAPFQPVGSGSKTTAPPLTDLAAKAGYDFDSSGYRERRAAERGVTRRR